MIGLLGTGCVAQQADLARIQKDLELQIRKIKEEKRQLAVQVDETKTQLATMREEAEGDLTKIRSSLASINQKATLLQEKDLTSLYGKLEEAENNINNLNKDFTLQIDNLKSDVQSLQTSRLTHQEELQKANTQTTALAQKVDENNQALTANMTEFQGSLSQFKDTLASLGTHIGQVQTDLTGFGTTLGQVRANLVTQQQELGTAQTHSEEMSQSIQQGQEAMDTFVTLFGTRLDEQSSQTAHLQQQITTLQDRLNADIKALRETLKTDTQALRAYLEHDVKSGMTQVVTDINNRQRPLEERMNALQTDLETLGTHVQADATQMQNLSQSVVKLREAQDVMGSLLGKRGDEIIQQAGQLIERMNTVEEHQTALTQQLQSNTQKTSTHLTEVNASLTSISQVLDQTSQALSGRLTQQEEAVKKLNQAIQQFQQLKDEAQSQIQQMQAVGQVTNKLRQTVEQMNGKIQDLEIHQSGLVGKLDSDAQTTNSHLQEVNKGITSIAQALESVSAKLNTRIDDHEQRLNRAVTSFQTVQGTAEVAQVNLRHLNELTETLNQLREVVNTIGTKLSERVDQHEDRLGQLAHRVNSLVTKRKK